MKIQIEKKDVYPYIYFVCSLSQSGRMHGALSSKNDFIGGIFDRWINIIPESIVFNKIIFPKINKEIASDIEVVSDYYRYDPKKAGIAPDVLGVKIHRRIIPFVKFDELGEYERWQELQNAPQIEVKSFKKSQYLVSLRDQNYSNKYLVMVETNLRVDYLMPFFEEYLFSEEVYDRLAMEDSVFIKSNKNNLVTPIIRIENPSEVIGELELISITNASDFMKYSTLCKTKTSPHYITEIRETRLNKYSIKEMPEAESFLINFLEKNNETNLYMFNDSWYNKIFNFDKIKTLDVYIENIENLQLIKKSKSSVIIKANSDAVFNDVNLLQGNSYLIKFGLLDRSANPGEEYFMHKTIVEKIPNKENRLISDIEKYIIQWRNEND